jgi:hypothetical protein
MWSLKTRAVIAPEYTARLRLGRSFGREHPTFSANIAVLSTRSGIRPCRLRHAIIDITESSDTAGLCR